MHKSTLINAFIIGLIAGINIASSSANAYTILDHADVTVKLPSDWTLVDIARNPEAIITNYAKNARDSQREESFVEAQVKKTNNDPTATVKEISDRLKKQARDQQCEVEDATPLPQDNSAAFKMWSQTFQCKLSKSGIIQYYLDADPTILYLFTYTTPNYPFTSALRDKANNLIKSSIYVCYKGKNCLSAN